MSEASLEYPSVEKLWQGANLRTIAHAIFLVPDAWLAYEVSWSGHNYSRNNTQGARGTITFVEDNAIGVFCDIHSQRSPFRRGVDYNFQTTFNGMPANLRKIAEVETSQYLLYEGFEAGTIPVVTAVFWSENGSLRAGEPWQSVLDNGAHLIHMETIETEAAMRELQEDYEMTPDQFALMQALFDRRVANPEKTIELTHTEMQILSRQGNNGLEASLELLEKIHIMLPK